jgi:hypothetical protein
LHNDGYEEFCLLGFLGYNALQTLGSQQTLRRNMSPPSSGSKNNPSRVAAFLLGLFFKPEDGGYVFLGNVD